jgi:hypothetical protein
MDTTHPHHWQSFSVDVDGKSYDGRYTIDGGMIVVQAPRGDTEETQLGGTPPESLAILLLSQMVREGRA